MAHFKYYEDDYELAVLELLENCGWEYQCGYDIHREKDNVVLLDDFQKYLSRKYGYFSEADLLHNQLLQSITVPLHEGNLQAPDSRLYVASG